MGLSTFSHYFIDVTHIWAFSDPWKYFDQQRGPDAPFAGWNLVLFIFLQVFPLFFLILQQKVKNGAKKKKMKKLLIPNAGRQLKNVGLKSLLKSPKKHILRVF